MDTQAELCETYQLKWSSHSTYLHSCIASSLHSSSSYTDVALITTDGHQIMAHRFVLSYSSQFLAQVLRMQPKVTSALPLMIVMPPEINHKSLKVLVRYMYSGEAKVTKDILQSVLKGGEILQVKGLYREKEDYDKNVKIIQPSNTSSVVQTTLPTTTTPPPLTIPNKTPVTINNTIPIKLTNNVSAVSKSNSIKVTSNSTTSKSDTVATSSKPAQTYPPSKFQSIRSIEPMPSTSGIPKEKLIQTSKSPQTFLVLQKPNPRAQVLNFTITHTFDQNGQLNKEDDPVQRKAVILNKPGETTTEDVVIKEEPKENNTLQYLMIKDEPIEWTEEIDVINPKEVFEDITLKTEVDLDKDDEDDNTDESQKEESMFSPLTCELCTATFSIPGDWVRHVQSHTDMLPAKRRRRDSAGDSYENDTFPELMCDLCQQAFPTPADWVKHIQSAHTEFELHMSNRKNPSSKAPVVAPKSITYDESEGSKQCAECYKTFPSHASMLIHQRKHTGERPYGCEYCNKSFNVKSNLLRHLRTLHNKMFNSREVDKDEDSSN